MERWCQRVRSAVRQTHARVGVQQVKIKFYPRRQGEFSEEGRDDGSSQLGAGRGCRSRGRRDKRSPGGVSRNAGTPSWAWKRPKDHILPLRIYVRGTAKISFRPHG